ncbi:MAG: TIR domain-containing protein [Candidatus Kentron sp. G]|nr:MAG: TIR domain-containing protein [Candidatus Kentron sp. G]VFN01774.1 MAG: TIR domain-containing protein [Candidatus Kentron sp. G]VFN03793.1 MAG: TIR domain-containing protein [Candidatus Kentron sp. G]
MPATRFHTFLSHNSADKPAVEELARRLQRDGIQCWLDKWHLIPGDSWQPAMEEALDACDSCCVFVGPGGIGPWQNEEMRAAIARRVQEGHGRFRVIPVVLPGGKRERRSRLPAFLAATSWVQFRDSLAEEEGFHRLESGIRGVAPGPGPGQAYFEGECPYRGLQVFQPEHAAFFFGREARVDWVLEKLRAGFGTPDETRFLAVIGASGSGKSSFVRAGLIPAIRQGKLEGSGQWPILLCRPGYDPLEELATALYGNETIRAVVPDAGNLMDRFAEEERRLHLTTKTALHGNPESRRAVIIVDQFEEVFTLCQAQARRRRFFDNLLYAATIPGGKTVVILTLRADFYARCSAYPELALALSENQELVPPMTPEELRRAIQQPARLSGCELESGLTEVLLREMKDQPGALPLLEHALRELWQRREGRRLTIAAYHEIGELSGALEQQADKLFHALNDAEQDACRRIFLRLVQPGEGSEDTKRRAWRRELGDTAIVDSVIQKMAGARLIVTEGDHETDREAGRDGFIEVSHEALIRGWPKLRGWIDADREAIQTQHRLAQSAREWREKMDESYLYTGALLAQAEEWEKQHETDLNDLEREFLDASVAKRDQQRREEAEAAHRLFRRTATGAVVAVVLMVVAVWMAWEANQQQQVAEEKTTEAEHLLANNYWASGIRAEKKNDPVAAAHFFAKATQKYSDEIAIKTGRLKLQTTRLSHNAVTLDTFLDLGGSRIVEVFDDRALILTGSKDTARLWRAKDGAQVAQMKHGYVWGSELSLDGSLIVTSSPLSYFSLALIPG